MPRDLPVGNGNLLVTFDNTGDMRDLYFPYVGLENHCPDHVCRLGVWTPEGFAWLADPAWQRNLGYEPETLVTCSEFVHAGLGLKLTLHDFVDAADDIFLRQVEVTNLTNRPRLVRVFQCLDLHIYGVEVGDTAYWEPSRRVLVNYKQRRYFLLGGQVEGGPPGIHDFATGEKEQPGREGTWRDAEDGSLGYNPIAQGSVDCAGGLQVDVAAGGTSRLWWYLAAGKTWKEVETLYNRLHEQGCPYFLEHTRAYWRTWAQVGNAALRDLPGDLRDPCRRSLLILRTNVDNRGAIVAANDGDVLRFARDTYSYVWPRDGALVAMALDRSGYFGLSQEFFRFCARNVSPDGFFLHKYNPDGSLASSWHPWVGADGAHQLPVQEDETGLVLFALWEHYRHNGDVEFIRSLYEGLIRPAGDFLAGFRHAATGLPAPSYDLWEERWGIHAFTVGAVWAGLQAAAVFAAGFGNPARADVYRQAAKEIRQAAEQHLYDPDRGRFVRRLIVDGDRLVVDPVIDSALHGLWLFGMFEPGEPRLAATIRAVRDRLWVKTPVGGVARYENDYYHQVSSDIGNVPGNPWFICTLWHAQWLIATAAAEADLAQAESLLRWCIAHGLRSGVLAEQVHPYDGSPLSVAPLTWSHAEFVSTAVALGAKARALRGRE